MVGQGLGVHAAYLRYRLDDGEALFRYQRVPGHR